MQGRPTGVLQLLLLAAAMLVALFSSPAQAANMQRLQHKLLNRASRHHNFVQAEPATLHKPTIVDLGNKARHPALPKAEPGFGHRPVVLSAEEFHAQFGGGGGVPPQAGSADPLEQLYQHADHFDAFEAAQTHVDPELYPEPAGVDPVQQVLDEVHAAQAQVDPELQELQMEAAVRHMELLDPELQAQVADALLRETAAEHQFQEPRDLYDQSVAADIVSRQQQVSAQINVGIEQLTVVVAELMHNTQAQMDASRQAEIDGLNSRFDELRELLLAVLDGQQSLAELLPQVATEAGATTEELDQLQALMSGYDDPEQQLAEAAQAQEDAFYGAETEASPELQDLVDDIFAPEDHSFAALRERIRSLSPGDNPQKEEQEFDDGYESNDQEEGVTDAAAPATVAQVEALRKELAELREQVSLLWTQMNTLSKPNTETSNIEAVENSPPADLDYEDYEADYDQADYDQAEEEEEQQQQ